MNREKVLSVAMKPALPLLSPNLRAPCQAQRNHSSICLKLPRFQQRLNVECRGGPRPPDAPAELQLWCATWIFKL